jgi:hypothetical protein
MEFPQIKNETTTLGYKSKGNYINMCGGDIYSPMFVAVLVTTVKKWTQPKHLSAVR